MNALVSTAQRSLAPTTMAEAMQFAEMLAGSTMVPRDYQGKPANILIAVQWGYEIGLGPLQAIQNISVINGRPSIWGDAAIALVLAHPAYVSHREWVDGDGDARAGYCAIIRRGSTEHVSKFSVADAKKAGLWGKQGPWQQYPDRMLQMRARGFAIRDKFADALRGVITTEEAQDTPPEPRFVQSTPEPAQQLPRVQDDPAAAPGWPLLTPDGRLVEVPDRAWLRAVEKALAGLESVDAILSWRTAMAQHLVSISAAGRDDLAKAAAEAIIRRTDAAMEAQGGEQAA